MASIDLKKVHKDQYTGRVGKPTLVTVPARSFLMIDGQGDPNTAQEYQDAVSALYPLAYGIRAAVKAATGDAYTVMPLEGLWWADDMSTFAEESKSRWKWTMMIGVPDVVSAAMAAEVLPAVTASKQLPAGDKVRLEVYDEGESAQIMYVGPYADEAPTIELLHDFITTQGRRRRGLHHEIYLSDPRRTAPEKLRTLIRQPVSQSGVRDGGITP
jgi:hypothetical protein